MPVQGFKRGDKVMTISGKLGIVTSTAKLGGREWIYVQMDDAYQGERKYAASTLRLLRK